MTYCARLVMFPVLVLSGCSNVSTAPEFEPDVDVKILFVGNSLTYTHDVPGLVRQLAARSDIVVATATIAHPDYSLQDHWRDGIAGHIRRLRPDYVVMQQGPSSLPESRAHLAYWSAQLAAVAREVDGEPVLYMVWPDVTRLFAFGDVEASYAEAAQSVDGLLIPAGTTWRRAWEQEPDLPLYALDGLHASYLGALAAAQTIHAGLFGIDASMIPSLDDGVAAAHLDVLRAAVAASLQQWGLAEQPLSR